MESWFLMLFALSLIETILSLTWNRLYFTIGLPVLVRRAEMRDPAAPLPSPAELEQTVGASAYPRLVFREMGEGRYGFRERAWGDFFRFSYTPVMRGLLIFERPISRVRVLGLANWFSIAFPVFLGAMMAGYGMPWFFVAFLLALEASIYVIQMRRFGQVARVAASVREIS